MGDVLGVIVAGGRSRRMGGGDKCLRTLGGRPILEWVVERARPQSGELILNANGDPHRFDDFGLRVVPDMIEGDAGPLAGILTGLEWAKSNLPGCVWVASFAADAPFVPMDYIDRLLAAAEEMKAPLACAVSGGRTHPVCGLWRVELADDLRISIYEKDIRKIDRWTAQYPLASVEFSSDPVDPFFNLNRREDLEAAELILQQRGGDVG